MLSRLLLLFILVPTIELILLIQIGQVVGVLPTIALIIFTGAVGAFLARRQGLQVLGRLRSQAQAGQLPADPLFDGAIILVASALLLTPGILTDIFGFLCLIPTTRQWLKKIISARVKRAIQSGQIKVGFQGQGFNMNMNPRREPENVVILDQDDYTTQN